MKFKAYQVGPEMQEAPELEDFAGLEVIGNRQYESHTSEEFDDIFHELAYGGDFDSWTIADADREELAALVDKYGTRGALDEKILARVLSIVTGQHWEHMEIHGADQSEWQIVYYNSALWTLGALRCFAMDYFNLGREWRVVGEDGDECYIYTYSDNVGELLAEIAAAMGTSAENIDMYLFDGWTRSQKYKEV